jgi:hypothetical protein
MTISAKKPTETKRKARKHKIVIHRGMKLPYGCNTEMINDAVDRVTKKCMGIDSLEVYWNGLCAVGYLFTIGKKIFYWIPVLDKTVYPIEVEQISEFTHKLSSTEFRPFETELAVDPKWWVARMQNSTELYAEKINRIDQFVDILGGV